MILHTFRVALRALRRRAGTAAINLVGLALASGVALLFGLAALGLARYDASFDGSDHVYNVYQDIVTPDNTRRAASTWAPLLPVLEAEFPDVAAGTRLGRFEALIGEGERATAQRVAFADSGYFAVFPFAFAAGDPAAALAGPGRAVVSTEAARRLFGDVRPADAIGRTLRLDRSSELVVTGVADVPRNVSVGFEVLVSWEHVRRHVPRVSASFESWQNASHRTYVRLRPQSDADALTDRLAPILERVREGDDRAGFRTLRASSAERDGFPFYARLLALVALGVLAIATINATNLALARSLDRAPEVGVRKVLGAGRAEVGLGYVAQTALVAVPAVGIGLALASAAVPWFNGTLDGILTLAFDLGDPLTWTALVGLAGGIALAGGAWPALVLSRVRPIDALAGRALSRSGGARLRGALIVGQFALTAFLLAFAATVHRQVDYLRALDFDFGASPVAVVDVPARAFGDEPEARAALRTLRGRLERDPAVASVALSRHVPGDCCSSMQLRPLGSDRLIDAAMSVVEPSYFAAYGIPTGTPVSAEPSGERRLVVNRAFARAAGWDEPVGQTLQSTSGASWTVAGVTPDLAFLAARSVTGPYVHLIADSLASGLLSVRASQADGGGLLAAVEAAWASARAQQALSAEWADARYDATYVGENALRVLMGWAAALAAVVSLIGLVGLAALLAAQRTKEIGVRKVLGASVAQVVVLLARGPAGYVLLAVALAALPVAWLVPLWLAQYPYQIPWTAGPLLLVGGAMLLVTVAVVALQAARAAAAAPADVLRDE